MRKIILSSNKLLHTIINHTFDDTDIKVQNTYVGKKLLDNYYVEFEYEESNGSLLRVRISSIKKEYLRFTIEEVFLYFMLIMEARKSNYKDNYYVSMSKIRSIRGLNSNSDSTYKKYVEALERLCSKEIRVIPYKTKYKKKPIICKMLEVSDKKYVKSNLSSFWFNFGDLDTTLVKSKQKIALGFNIFSIPLKKGAIFLFYVYILRMIFINRIKYSYMNLSVQKVLMFNKRISKDGTIQNEDYYSYLSRVPNKRTETLNKFYIEVEELLKQLVKGNIIISYKMPDNRSFKYIRDNEVLINIKFEKVKE